MRRVLIYCTEVLPLAQTFIFGQTSALRRFRPQYIGLGPSRRSFELTQPALLMTHDHSFRSRVRRNIYKFTGIAPHFHDLAARSGAELLQVHFAEEGALAVPLARSVHIPMVITLHGSIEPIPTIELLQQARGRFYLMRRQEIWGRTSLFLCVSNFMRKKAIAAGYPANKLRVHYVGIDCNTFSPEPSIERQELVLFVGRLVPKKGCNYLIRAMQEVQELRPGVKLVVIGDGPDRPELEKLAASLRVNVSFLGSRSSLEIRDWLRRAKVFCGPSVTARDGNSEGLGMVFLEAQSVGLPVVSFEHGGVPEAVLNGKTGLLAPEGDSKALAANILRLLEDKTLWQSLSEAGIQWVRSTFDLHKQTRVLEEVYEGVINEFHQTHPN